MITTKYIARLNRVLDGGELLAIRSCIKFRDGITAAYKYIIDDRIYI